MVDSAPPAPPENQVTEGPGAKNAPKSYEDDLGKLTGALAKRDYAKLREELTSYLAKQVRAHAGSGLVALGLGAVASPAGGLAAGFLVQWLSARFEGWIKDNSADEKLKKAVEDAKDNAERRLLLRDIQAWLTPTLAAALSDLELHSEALLAVIEHSERHEAKLDEVLSRVLDPAADTLAALLQTHRLELPTNPSPAQLLDARYGVVPFDVETRKAELAALQSLCDADGLERVEMQLLVGPGGSGKTRLAMQFCERLWGRTNAHWHAGFLLQEGQAKAIAQLTRPGYPALIVIDYAESRNLGSWLRQLMNTENARPKLRILLLARHAGEWWETLAQGDAAVKHLCRHPVIRLQDVMLGDGARQRHHGRARAAFADKLQKSGATSTAPKLDEARYARPLYVHMAALSTLLDAPVPDANPNARALPWEMVQRESAWWAPTSDGLPWGILRLMAAVTLLGGAITTQLKRLCKALDLPPDEELRRRLARYYPKNKGVGALEPDLLGEALVFHTLQHDETSDDFLSVALQDASLAQVTQALTVLGRIAPDHPEQGRQWVRQIIDESPLGRADAAFKATFAVSEKRIDDVLGQELARSLERHTDLELAQNWAEKWRHETIVFREVGLWVFRQLAASAKDDETKARYTLDLGIVHYKLAQREEALSTTEKAVAIYRQLAQAQPASFLPLLAKSLSILSGRLGEVGRKEEALDIAKEAVCISRQLAKIQPETFLPTLAFTVERLGWRQLAMDRHKESVSAGEEAVAIYRQLAQQQLDSDLAMSLRNLGASYYAHGQRKEALSVTEEAVASYRQLARARPDSFLYHLARALTYLSVHLSEFDRQEEALSAAEEAVAIYKQLAQARTAAFLPHLAMALRSMALRLEESRREREALSTARESLSIYEPLAQRWPDAFGADLSAVQEVVRRLSDETAPP